MFENILTEVPEDEDEREYLIDYLESFLESFALGNGDYLVGDDGDIVFDY